MKVPLGSLLLCLLPCLSVAQHPALEALEQLLAKTPLPKNYAAQTDSLVFEMLSDHPDEAFALTTKAIEKAESTKDTASAIRLLDTYIAMAFRTRKLQNTVSYAEQLLQWSRATGDWKGEMRALGAKGNIQYFRGVTDSLLIYYQQALDLALAHNDKAHIAKFNANLAVAHKTTGNYEKAIEGYRKALEMMEEVGDSTNIGFTAYNMANLMVETSQFDSAIVRINQAIAVFEALNMKSPLVNSRMIRANIYSNQGQYEAANTEALEMIRMQEELKDTVSLIFAHGNLASDFMKLENYEKAREHYQIAMDYAQTAQFASGITFAKHGMAQLYQTQNKWPEAWKAIFEALENAESQQATADLAEIYEAIGGMYLAQDSLPQAEQYLLKAQDALEQMGRKKALAQVYTKLGQVYVRQQNYTAAKSYADKAVALFEVINLEPDIETKEVLADAYAGAGDFANAYRYQKAFSVARDSTLSAERNAALARIESEYQVEKKDAELARQQLAIERGSKVRQQILLIGIILILALVGLYLNMRTRQRFLRQQAKLKDAEAEQLRKIDQLKSNFFANISHEFRTPLTLIMGPLREMAENRFTGNAQNNYQIMLRNSQRLLRLVNQLLDLSRLESGRMELEVQHGDASAFIRAIAYSFESLAESKQIQFSVEVPAFSGPLYFDADKLEKILSNLLSNAFKFTPEEGSVSLSAHEQDHQIYLEVKDSGMGIPTDQLPNIFDRFFTKGETHEMESSGIGLALTKELVDLMEGTINVQSQEGRGTNFSVVLPADERFLQQGATLITKPERQSLLQKENEVLEGVASVPKGRTGGKLQETVLIVEDNADVRQYIKDQLVDHYALLEAADGAAGLELALREVPSLIISDIMMPKMNGVELCNRLKAEEATSHIPVILLTAKAEQEDKLEGLEQGADDYLTKPFDIQELKLRVGNLIEQRKRWRERFSKEISFKPQEVAVTPVDEQFLQQVLEVIEANMDDEFFGVPKLAGEVGLSRSQLHRKLKALSDKSPSQIIRDMRLQRAKALLEQQAGNASEVAFMVGFNSLAYFSKCFKEAYGVAPSGLNK
ncbi:MAG: response regulator [Phaeodactylibacter sp.]|nr:response regulator [Phaeodactylibacter sp.]